NTNASLHNLAEALHHHNKPDEAIACYKKVIERDPKGARTLHNLGHVLEERKKLDEAASYFRKALEVDPQYGEAYADLGNILSAQHRPDEAATYFRKAIELDPKSRGAATAYHRIAQSFEREGKWKEAIEYLQKAVDVPDPGFAGHWNALAW